MSTGDKIIEKAKTYLGFGPHTFNYDFGVPDDTAWCCIFVWYIFKHTGNSKLFYNGGKVAYCPYAIFWCKENLREIAPHNALPGDIVFFDWNENGSPDHIGFIIKGGYNSCQTIEGNTSGNKVAIRQRSNSTICGIYRPNYSEELITISRNYQVSKAQAYVRRGASSNYSVVQTLKNGAIFHASKMTKDKKWVYKDGSGWVLVSALRLLPAVVTINRRYKVLEDATIRRGAQSKYKAVGTVKKGTVIRGLKMYGNWIWTDYGQTGWINSATKNRRYLEQVNNK